MKLIKRECPVKIEKRFDTFDYEIKRIKYDDGSKFGDALLRCVFIINGKDILDILMENSKTDESFHHTTLADLGAFDLNEASYRPGRIHILICSCDELGCDNINVKVTENKDGVVWNDFRFDDAIYDDTSKEESDVQELKLSFEFEKDDYKRKIETLKILSGSLCGNYQNKEQNTKLKNQVNVSAPQNSSDDMNIAGIILIAIIFAILGALRQIFIN